MPRIKKMKYMRTWHKQVVVNTLKATIPCKQILRQGLRYILPYQTDPGLDSSLFDNSIRQIELLNEAGLDIRGCRVLEIGSGWHPILAMTFLAAGAECVTLTDVERLLDKRLVRSAIDFVLTHRDRLAGRFNADSADRLKIDDGDLPEMLKQLGLGYCVPYRTETFPDRSFNTVVSCSVLEHIAPETLEKMVVDFRRILVPGGSMVHFIDYSDHYAMYDKSLSRCNFLRYEDWIWRLCCINPQSYHNRLRHSDYVAMFQRYGFTISYEWRLSREKEQREIATMTLSSRFIGRDIDDLAAVGGHFVLIAP